MLVSEPELSSVSSEPTSSSRETLSYLQASTKAAVLARIIDDLSIDKPAPERRRLGVLRDAARKIQACLCHVGSR
jgi:hypothetical protein